MSRAPARETPHSSNLSTALSPYGVIDFADNHASAVSGLQALAAVNSSLQASAGPPAYLEAHGIRYVPSMASPASFEETRSEPSFVPMGKEVESQVMVDPRELNSRVDERIRRFMEGKGDSGLSRMASSAERNAGELNAQRKFVEMRRRVEENDGYAGLLKQSMGAAESSKRQLSRKAGGESIWDY